MKAICCAAALLVGVFFYAGCDSDDDPNVPVPPEPEYPEFVIPSSDYLNHRFFNLDLPEIEPDGRQSGDIIVPETIKIFKGMERGVPQPGDLPNIAAYVDSLGCGSWSSIDFSEPCLWVNWWREVSWYPLVDGDGALFGVDLNVEYSDQDVLAVVYDVRHHDGALTRVGDSPGLQPPEQELPGEEGLFYRMKLLKAPADFKELHSFGYVLRNVYSLGAVGIDPSTFSLRIERLDLAADQPHRDGRGLDYIRIFGLDRDNSAGEGHPDGQVDVQNPLLFDLQRGLFSFAPDFPRPFAPAGRITMVGNEADLRAEAAYAAFADTTAFVWRPSYLRSNQAWQFYDPETNPVEFPVYSAFRIIATYPGAPTELN